MSDEKLPLFKQKHKSYKDLNQWKAMLGMLYHKDRIEFSEDGPYVICFLKDLDKNEAMDTETEKLHEYFGTSPLGIFNTRQGRGKVNRIKKKEPDNDLS